MIEVGKPLCLAGKAAKTRSRLAQEAREFPGRHLAVTGARRAQGDAPAGTPAEDAS